MGKKKRKHTKDKIFEKLDNMTDEELIKYKNRLYACSAVISSLGLLFCIGGVALIIMLI